MGRDIGWREAVARLLQAPRVGGAASPTVGASILRLHTGTAHVPRPTTSGDAPWRDRRSDRTEIRRPLGVPEY